MHFRAILYVVACVMKWYYLYTMGVPKPESCRPMPAAYEQSTISHMLFQHYIKATWEKPLFDEDNSQALSQRRLFRAQVGRWYPALFRRRHRAYARRRVGRRRPAVTLARTKCFAEAECLRFHEPIETFKAMTRYAAMSFDSHFRLSRRCVSDDASSWKFNLGYRAHFQLGHMMADFRLLLLPLPAMARVIREFRAQGRYK